MAWGDELRFGLALQAESCTTHALIRSELQSWGETVSVTLLDDSLQPFGPAPMADEFQAPAAALLLLCTAAKMIGSST